MNSEDRLSAIMVGFFFMVIFAGIIAAAFVEINKKCQCTPNCKTCVGGE